MEKPPWATEDVDLDRPSIARVYDYFLGGSHNFAVDRQMAEQLKQLAPDMPMIPVANRAFMRRAVQFMIGAGVRQLLDIGSGIPTVGNVHEVAYQVDPSVRVVYVDIDPVAVAHSRSILAGAGNVAVVQADLRQPDVILGSPEVKRLIDLSQPVGVLIVAVLHFLSDAEQPYEAVARLRAAVAPGSYLAISHAARESRPETEQAQEILQRSAGQGTLRSRDEIARFFGDFELVDPGLVYLPLWRPESPAQVYAHPERFVGYAGVGRKP